MLLSKYPKISYEDLNAKQKEKYNYQKVSAILADYGFITIPLSDDWNGADFLAVHKNGDTLKVQLKGRLTISQKYQDKDLYICFPDGKDFYLFPHDLIKDKILEISEVATSESWEKGTYSWKSLVSKYRDLLEPYRIGHKQDKAA